MKKLLVMSSLILSSTVFASDFVSTSISGTFRNNNGCEVRGTCELIENSGEKYNLCRLSIIVDNETVAYFGKGGKVVETDGKTLKARDKGVRWGYGPEYVDYKANFNITKKFQYSSSLAEVEALEFDVVAYDGSEEVANCKALEYVSED